MIRYLLGGLAIVLLIIGIVALISPLPIGVILIAIGLSILVCVSDTAKMQLKKVRTKYSKINQKLHLLEGKLEKRFAYLVNELVQTRPNDKRDDAE